MRAKAFLNQFIVFNIYCNINPVLSFPYNFASRSTTFSTLHKSMSGIFASSSGAGFVDVHAHIIHEKFIGKEEEIAEMCKIKGLDHVIVNGIEPISNRAILNYCMKHSPIMLPALGIYPLDAACNYIYTERDVEELKASSTAEERIPDVNWRHEFSAPKKFDVDEEILFIEECVKNQRIIAIGECGLDKYYLNDEASMLEQERVLRKLMKIGVKYDIPLILHSRKAEQRVFEMLQEEGVKKADFHCFCGKVKLGEKIAAAGYYLSIPSAIITADKNNSFRRLAMALPMDRILTETDSPYLGPIKGTDNTPDTVVGSIDTLAEIKGIPVDEMKNVVRNNFRTLFGL